MEACGTSGMKAALNAVPQLGTPDGWWAEGFTGKNGWMLPRAGGADPDVEDGERVYQLLESEIVPMFYARNAAGVPTGWTERMKHALREAGERFTARRMTQAYVRDYYMPATRGEPPADPPTA
jgi:starch phosphorylase